MKVQTFYYRLYILLLMIFEFLGSNEKKPENKPAAPLLEKYSEKITVSFGSAKEDKGKEPVKTTGPKEVSKPPEKDVEMIDLEPDKTKTKGPTPPPPATSQSKFNQMLGCERFYRVPHAHPHFNDCFARTCAPHLNF